MSEKELQKGLSNLQKFILCLAVEQEGHVMARDVLVKYYGFIPVRSPSKVGAGGMVYKKSGIAGYNAATVPVCKAFNRLVGRGLAYRTDSVFSLK